MKTILTPQQVLNLAFSAGEYLPPESLSETLIAAAEERYVRPILGRRLYERLLEGEHADFSSRYIKPLAAVGAKRLLLPQLRLRACPGGVVSPKTEGWQAASEESFHTADRALRAEIETLSRRLHEELERLHAEGSLPDYDPKENIRNRCRNHGGLLQIL